MSILDAINKILHYGDHEQILFDVILGAIVGGIGVGIAKSSFKGDYSNIIELIIGGGLLLNYPFNPISHGIGFVLAVDGFSSIVNYAFKEKECEECVPLSCYGMMPLESSGTNTDPPSSSDSYYSYGGDASYGPPLVFYVKPTPECGKYLLKQFKEELGLYPVADPGSKPTTAPSNFSSNNSTQISSSDVENFTSSELSKSVSESESVSDKDVSETSE